MNGRFLLLRYSARSPTLPLAFTGASGAFRRLSGSSLSCRARSRVSLVEVSALGNQVAPFKGKNVSLSYQYPDGQLRIVEYPDPLLRAKNKSISVFDANLRRLVDEMFDVMYKVDGIGLSAPQVGVNAQLFVFNPSGEYGKGELVLINPKIQKISQNIVLFNEGCLSFPGIYADIERPMSLKVAAQDVAGAQFTKNLSGLSARIFQHEFDHLQGILFTDRMTDEELDHIYPEIEAGS